MDGVDASLLDQMDEDQYDNILDEYFEYDE